MPHRKMSREEHDETIATIATQVRFMVKFAPYIGGLFTIIAGIAGFAIGAYKYDANIVKQPQFAKEVTRSIKADSTLNAKIDTVSSKIVYGNYTQHKDKNGNITYREYAN
jgi:hypothetical protein